MKKILIFIALMAQVVLFCTCDKEINHSKLPTVTTATPVIEDGKLIGGGEVTDDGGSNITDKGVIVRYDYHGSEVFDLDHCYTSINAGTGKGAFTCDITDMYERYFVIRAYATNKTGTAYGEVISVSLTGFGTPSIFSITQNSAIASVTVNGNIQECGFCWSTSSNPSINNSSSVATWVNDHYRTTLTGLQPNTRYYVKAYVKDNYGISYSSEVNFVTSQACPASVQDYDGNTYGVVSIGSQCWMKENLRTTHLNNGTAITLVQDSTAWSNRTTGAYCYYNKTNYGHLYNYYAVAYGNLCPSGWHVPSYDEVFTTLYNALDASNVGGKMKVTGTTYWMSPNTGATNSSGFSARGGGYRPRGYGFRDIRKSAVFWTTTTYSSDYAYDFMMSYDAGELYRYGSSAYDYSIDKKSGLSVRCVKNSSKDSNESNVVVPAAPAPSKEARE
ncbi:MAG: fibrobacter succinogenes major paralogous domain-containing protein [Bacteroidales bacterium]|nr:fibrobacter succinogenes major paralogous domain-containing protein [Bacteroidales bacterium]